MTHPPPSAPDAQLIEAVVQRANEQAFRELHRRHSPVMYRALLWLLGNDENEADEALQDAWVAAARALPTFRGDSAFSTWLVTIAYRQGCNRMRATSRLRFDALSDDASSPTTSPDATVDIERAVARLPEGERAIFLMHDVEGWTHQEIGDRLGINSGTSKSQLFSARRRLRKWLGDREATDGSADEDDGQRFQVEEGGGR